MDDYLWNKTGSDPEIERIEVALLCLAYKTTAPPEIPAKQFAFTAPRRSFFRFGVTFATAFAVLVAFGLAWMMLRKEAPVNQQVAEAKVFQPPVAPIRIESGAPAFAQAPAVSSPIKVKRRVAAPRSRISNAIRPQTLVLTKEEADAYRQLMTALNITSTNLKIVKDKLDGTE